MEETRFCPLCGDPFFCKKNSRRVWCSKKCRDMNSAKNTREKKNERNRKYRASHPGWNKAAEQRYRERHKEKIAARDRGRSRARRECTSKEQRQIIYNRRDKEKDRVHSRLKNARCRESLSRHYVAFTLGLKVSELSDELFLKKREQLIIYRTVKQLLQTIKEIEND